MASIAELMCAVPFDQSKRTMPRSVDALRLARQERAFPGLVIHHSYQRAKISRNDKGLRNPYALATENSIFADDYAIRVETMEAQ